MFGNKTFFMCFSAIPVLLLTCSRNSMLPSCSLVVHDVQYGASVLNNAIALLLLLIVKGSFGKFGQIERVFIISLTTYLISVLSFDGFLLTQNFTGKQISCTLIFVVAFIIIS